MNPLIIKELTSRYGSFTSVRLTGGYTNETFLLEGIEPLRVAKVVSKNNSDFTNETRCLQRLEDTNITPKFYDLIECSNECISVMQYRKGTNGQVLLDQGEVELVTNLYQTLGEVLAGDIHTIKYSGGLGIKESNEQSLNLNLNFVPAELIEQSQKILSKIYDDKNEWVLTHGDFGIHNVLFSKEDGLTVLDWEWAEWGNPLNDISWVFWFTHLHYPDHAPELCEVFLKHYLEVSTISLDLSLLRAYSVYKVWKVLQKVESAPFEVQNEWVRRLEWTLKSKIFKR
ncbi:phosphotransferase [Bacillus sp. 31A1R]|uniref:Phosphotransferase n=1 Tax=Robertmurraya mangrovi TaxID=3098077 RepID=A0ABU5J2H1_9BACI|nr:phosphotransferase [Bacillus sp. 31A1R]MDZ5473613.1 phosphotransferase [Bacillus sp. 31A1R]